MMKARNLVLAAAMGLVTTLAVPAFAQYGRDDRDSGWQQDQDHDGDRDRDYDRDQRYRNNGVYQDGYRDGMRDRREGHNWANRNNHYRDNDDRQAYISGYRDGYNAAYGNGNRGWYPGNGGHGSDAYDAGRRFGFEDGLRYGSHDRHARRAFKPTASHAYHDADHGYNHGFGDKGQFRRAYRQGYQQGYQEGYYGR